MKPSLLLLAVACVLAADSLFIGCGPGPVGPVTDSRALKTAQAIYLDVRTVVTDPEVVPMFAPAELKRLGQLEQTYLAAADTLRRYPDDQAAIAQLSFVATEILGIIDEVTFVGKVRPYVAAIRISVKILQNHL